ncbi:MAG: hypothetical protein O8C66_00030 [Candidatus Methanoperedens sp.]|nr:hypothetical protein [Candidatus Methanoperedens sp.]
MEKSEFIAIIGKTPSTGCPWEEQMRFLKKSERYTVRNVSKKDIKIDCEVVIDDYALKLILFMRFQAGNFFASQLNP